MSSTRQLFDAAGYAFARLVDSAPLKVAAGMVAFSGWLTTPGVNQAAVILLIADWATGTFKGWITHQMNSDAGVRGAIKSLIYLGLLAVGHQVAAAGPIVAEAAQWAAIAVILTEAISVLENLDAIATSYRVDLPILRQTLSVMRMKQTQIGTGPLPPTQLPPSSNGGPDA